MMINQAWVDKIAKFNLDDEPSTIGAFKYENIDLTSIDEILEQVIKKSFVKEIFRRGWITLEDHNVANKLKVLRDYIFHSSARKQGILQTVHFKRSSSLDTIERELSTVAWLTHVVEKGLKVNNKEFDKTNFNKETLIKLVQFSSCDNGPKLALELLSDLGISVIFEQTLPLMKLDGASLLIDGMHRVIVLTLRFDRVDNFWFALFHELGHILLHLESSKESNVILDTIFSNEGSKVIDETIDDIEYEANVFAKDALIPRDLWKRSPVRTRPTKENVLDLAKSLKISPSIIIGRLQYEKDDYTLLKNMSINYGIRESILGDD